MFHEAINAYAETFLYEEPQGITYCYIGECFEKLEMPEEAYENFLRASEIEPDLAESWLGMGIAMSMLERHKEAIPLIERAIALEDTNPDYFYIFAEILEKSGRFEDAQEAFEKASQMDPDNIELILDHSRFLAEQLGWHEGIKHLEQELVRLNANAELLFRLSAYLFQAGKKAESLRVLEEALAVDPEGYEKLFDYLPDLKSIPDFQNLIDQYKK
jgi:tetratricopeptide (TPR) repeat protein